jgi:hypothetical protein
MQATKTLNRYWVSWWSGYYESEGCSEPPFQIWVTGYRDRKKDDKDEESFCAVIDAESEHKIRVAIRKYFPDYELRFCNLAETNWTPESGGRFPNYEGRTLLERRT